MISIARVDDLYQWCTKYGPVLGPIVLVLPGNLVGMQILGPITAVLTQKPWEWSPDLCLTKASQ